MKCDAVFEGGGVKAVAFIGAIKETEKRGYTFNQLAGTSAGSIVASLLAAGYTGDELEPIFESLAFNELLDLSGAGKIPLLGKALNLLLKNGVYQGAHFESWMASILKRKGVVTFDDLPVGKLKIIASDISNGRLIIIPDDLHRYGIDPLSFPVSRAIRMSACIPYFFQPAIIEQGKGKTYVVDGGILSNYPIWLFDSPTTPRWPTFGYRLGGARGQTPAKVTGPVSMLLAIFSTMIEAHDRMYIGKQDAARTLFLPTGSIKATDFSINEQQKKLLIQLGKEEAEKFFDTWDFNAYLLQFRKERSRA